MKAFCKFCNHSFAIKDMLPGYQYCSTSCLTKAGSEIIIRKFKTHKSYRVGAKKKVVVTERCDLCDAKIDNGNRLNHRNSKKCIKRQNKKQKPLAKIDLWSSENQERWQKLRYEVFKKYGRICMVCGATSRLHVDHIKPKSKYPELAFNINNLQILCADCNYGKGFEHEDDWRPK